MTDLSADEVVSAALDGDLQGTCAWPACAARS